MATSPHTDRYFYGIDVIRFIAALAVVWFHLAYLNQIADYSVVVPIAWFGWIGVEIFFVVSGFVIANSANGKTPGQFVRGRARRLYPAVWCCATITMLVRLVAGEGLPDLLPSYFRSLALLPKGPWIDDVYWTLAVEIGFYFLIFLILVAGLFSYLSRVALALTVLSTVCLGALVARHWFPILTWPAFIIDHANVFLARHGCFFAVGIWLWLSSNRPLKSWEIAALLVAVMACFAEIVLRGLEFFPPHLGYLGLLSPLLAWSAATGFIFFIARNGNIFAGSANLIRMLGLMTYPLYLVHHIVGLTIERSLVDGGVEKWLAMIAAFVPGIFLSWLLRDIGQRKRFKLPSRQAANAS